MTEPQVSVVIAARDAADTLGECLRAVAAQSLPRDQYEVIVVVDMRSGDETLSIARSAAAAQSATVVVELNPPVGATRYTGGSRNAGIRIARGAWVAFIDADCIASRGWLRALVTAAVGTDAGRPAILGVAGQTLGLESRTAAARYVDLTGGLRAEHHLAHERYPWPPGLNVLYRRDALVAVDGFDDRFVSYEVADLHTRLRRELGGAMVISDRALVHHRHRAGWRAYWRQQASYGEGYAQFFRRYREELPWTAMDEARAWLALLPLALRALLPGKGDEAILRRGHLVKKAAQRVGFTKRYWSPAEAARWRARASVTAPPGA